MRRLTFLATLLAAIAMAGCGLDDRCPGKEVCNGGCMTEGGSCCPSGSGFCEPGFTCGADDLCRASAGGAGGSCGAWVIACGQTQNGIQVVGGIVPLACACPQGTTKAGEDRVTAGGPYNICTCNGY